jgi:PepSY-associated TM region
MRVLTWLHRWWGVVFCLLFAMWFASGIVMHFVPFPARSADRFAALVPIDPAGVVHGPAEAIAQSGIAGVLRVALVGRSDGPIYLISGPSGTRALRAGDLSDGKVDSERLALDIGIAYAKSRGLGASGARVAGLIELDQWTVSGEFDSDRPLYRVLLGDASGTELYVASTTGDVVLVTAQRARALNYFGSIAHWLYPTSLRQHRLAWSALMWWLSLVATIGAGLGVIAGLLHLIPASRRGRPVYGDLQAWHHRLGLVFAPFILGWIFSGFLSMDDGRLPDSSRHDVLALAGTPPWDRLQADEPHRVSGAAREIEWFALAGHIYRRERTGLEEQRLSLAMPEAGAASPPRAFLRIDEIDSAATQLGGDCGHAAAVGAEDPDSAKPALRDAPVFRICCGNAWYEIDGSTGALLNRLDPRLRIYHWLFSRLHRLDFAALQSRPMLRTTVIVALCLCGLAFSLSGAVLAWRRLRANVGRF